MRYLEHLHVLGVAFADLGRARLHNLLVRVQQVFGRG